MAEKVCKGCEASLPLDAFSQSVMIERFTGIPMAVDHVVPLAGRTISGLHVEGNLRIITREENGRKSNRYIPELLTVEYPIMVLA